MSTNTGTKRKMRSITAIAMVLAMVMSLFGGITFAPVTAYATNGVSYQEGSWDSTSKSVKFETKTATENVVELQSTTTSWEDGKWYVVPDNGVTISERITVAGTVNLILTDGATLTASKGITVSNSNTLNIFAQSGETGILDATAYYNDDWINDSRTASAAIGGFYDGSTNNSSCGTVNIHGGNINANKSDFSNAAIGGALYGNGGNITIYGGTIKAYGGDNGAGIGAASNDNCSGGTITIYGGSVTAVGGRGNINPGIGAKCGCTEALVSIYGGTVIATGGNAGGPFGPGDGIGFSGRQSTVTYAENSIVLGENVKLYGSSDNTTWSELTSPFSTRYQYMKSETITPATYSVTYDANGALEGSVPAELASYDANASVTVLGNTGDLEKDDYTFAGWNTKADGTGTDYAAGDTFTITADTTLYAKWTANTITVTFSTSTDGKTINKGGVTCNSSFDSYNNLFMGGTFSTTLGNFTRIVVTAQDTNRIGMDNNYNSIAGWSGNTWTGNASSVNFGEIMGHSNNVTIVFTITPVTNYTVTFNSKGGSDVTSASVAEGNKVSKPTNPTRDGYTFLGWSTEETSSTYYDFDTAVTSSFTLYAQWEKKVETGVSDTSDIAVAVEGLTDAIDTSDLNANQYVTSEIEVKNEAVTDVSNTVSNKVSEVKGTDSSITVNYLTIDISKIITTVNANGSTTDGTKTAVTELTKPIEVAIPNIDGDKVDIVREHVGTATQFTERNSRNTVPVSFVDGEYYYDKANKIVYIYSSKFSTYAILIKPANNTGGNPGGNTGGNTGGGTGGGGYSGPTYYTVTFNSNGGSTVTSQSVRSGNKVTKPADPTKEGYTFDGWYTTNSLTTEFDFNTAIYSSRTLYAKWTENTTPTPTVTTYQITYDLDGGTVAKANPTSYTKDTATFTLNNPTKSGYTFKGWIGSDLSKATVTVTVKKGSTGNRVYKATWEKNSDSSSEEDSSPVTPNGKTEEQNALTLNAGLKVSQTGKKITVKFGKVAGATSYEVYVAYCGQKFPTKATATTKKNSVSITKLNGKKLNLKKNFKIYVVAKKSKAKLGKTITAHVVGHKNVKYTNAKSIKITSKTTLTLKKGKKSQIKAKTILVDSKKKQLTDAHAKEFRYASSNKKVATVSKTGKITAKGKGTATIYVYSRNGYAKKVKVTVK